MKHHQLLPDRSQHKKGRAINDIQWHIIRTCPQMDNSCIIIASELWGNPIPTTPPMQKPLQQKTEALARKDAHCACGRLNTETQTPTGPSRAFWISN
jgi:hypothetical protein